ncbi:MAG: S8 family peptidase [Actinomycetes bacterium]
MATQGPEGRNPILEAEVALVLDNHDGIGISPDDWRERGSYDYLYKKNEFLVSDRDLDRAQRELGGLDVVDSVLDGVSLLRGGDADVRPVLDRVDAALGPGVVTPNHVLSVCPIKLCPATEPAVPATPQPWPSVADVKEGKGVRIAVVDTGFLREGWDKPWLDGVIADDPADIEDPDWWPAKDNYIDPYAGHGTFIAGVIRCLAPGAEVSVEQVLDKAGVVDEAALIKQLDDALAKSPDVISFSAGGYTRRNVPPKAFVEFYESRLRHLKGVVLVAAAGNDSERTPFWPAAFPWAVSVGSLDATGRRRSAFSNFGGWVDVYAPGEDLVNAYATGRYQSVFNPADIRDFPDGMCEWSGTSFSTPVVAALIAARMARAGENGRQAADALLTAARIQATPGVGPRLWF